MKRHIAVVGAVIVRGGEVLCAQRGPSGALAGKWEFPGGKVEPDETPRHALAREIREELDCGVAVGAEVATTTHEYDFAIVTLTTFYCELTAGEPAQSEHASLLWLEPASAANLDWAPADVPAVQRIQRDFAIQQR